MLSVWGQRLALIGLLWLVLPQGAFANAGIESISSHVSLTGRTDAPAASTGRWGLDNHENRRRSGESFSAERQKRR
ncbi:MAG: hypothetical protein HC850_02290 [Rhodomicrobium sp.]|nr:hypothetical protein [Rhodomicrobium sp.]